MLMDEIRDLFADYREILTDLGLDAHGEFCENLLQKRLTEQREQARLLLPDFDSFPSQTLVLFHGVVQFNDDGLSNADILKITVNQLKKRVELMEEGAALLRLAERLLDADSLDVLLQQVFLMQKLWKASGLPMEEVGAGDEEDAADYRSSDDEDKDGALARRRGKKQEKQWAEENGFDLLPEEE